MRCSAATAHLRPALKRPNVTLITEAFTRKILQKWKSFWVEFDNNGEVQEVYSSNSVIVSCGAIKSPQILMLSG